MLRESLVEYADIGGATGADSVAAFADVVCLVPRLKVDVSLSLSMIHLQVLCNPGVSLCWLIRKDRVCEWVCECANCR